MRDNITSVVKDGLCTGCGTCVGLCHNDALEMVIDKKKGIYVPVINEEKCNNCGFCIKVCPGHEVDFSQLNQEIFGKQPDDILLGNYINCFTGYATDNDIRYNSSSGGLVTALLIHALEEGIINGALVTKMRKDRPLEPLPFIARTREEIISASGSKYCPVPANIALKEIMNAPDGEKFAVVGLPCHIHGIRKAELLMPKLRNKIVLHLGIACDHTPSFCATEYLIKQNKIKLPDVSSIKYRGLGWPGKIQINNTTGDPIIKDYQESWKAGFGILFTPIRCLSCIDKGNELADLLLADAWNLSSDNIGTSLVVIRSIKSDDYVNNIINNNVCYVQPVLGKYINNVGLKIIAIAGTSSKLSGVSPKYKIPLINYSIKAYIKYFILKEISKLSVHKSTWYLLANLLRIYRALRA
jgi:coenzyme F420 hydrogenase subunit beta